jgi:hypothetical protein
LYARISEDPLDQKRGVKRQFQDLPVFAEEPGGEVAGEWTGHDLSAQSGEERPGYDEMMEAALAAGRRPGGRVIVAAYQPIPPLAVLPPPWPNGSTSDPMELTVGLSSLSFVMQADEASGGVA